MQKKVLKCTSCEFTTHFGPHISVAGVLMPIQVKNNHVGKKPCKTCDFGAEREKIIAQHRSRISQPVA